jgi:hypothetical protein
LFDVAVVDPVSLGYKHLVPSVVARLVSADQENGCPSKIESIQDAIRPALMLYSQFPHMWVPRQCHAGAIRVLERHAIIFEQLHIRSDAFLLIGREPTPPFAELVGELDLTCHPVHIMPLVACAVKWARRTQRLTLKGKKGCGTCVSEPELVG